MLGIGQKPEPVSHSPQRVQRLLHMGIQSDVADRGNPEKLRRVHAQRVRVLRNSLIPEQLRHNLFNRDVRKALVALSRLRFPPPHRTFKSRLQFRAGIGGAVKTEIQRGLFPHGFIFIGVNIHQCAI